MHVHTLATTQMASVVKLSGCTHIEIFNKRMAIHICT